MEGEGLKGKGLKVGDVLTLEQLFDWKEIVGWEARNRYRGTSDGTEVFIAEEAGNTCERQCCAQARTTTQHSHGRG